MITSIFLYGYIVPMTLSAAIMCFYVFRDAEEEFNAEGHGDDVSTVTVTVSDVVIGTFLCVVPLFNWVIPIRFIWESTKELEGRLKKGVQKVANHPIVSIRRHDDPECDLKRRSTDE